MILYILIILLIEKKGHILKIAANEKNVNL